VVDVRPFIRPILMTLFDAVFSKRCQHDNHHTATLPNHLHDIAESSITMKTETEGHKYILNIKKSFLNSMIRLRVSAELTLNIIGLNNSTPLVPVIEV